MRASIDEEYAGFPNLFETSSETLLGLLEDHWGARLPGPVIETIRCRDFAYTFSSQRAFHPVPYFGLAL